MVLYKTYDERMRSGMKSERLRLASVLADTATIGYIRAQYPWLAKELDKAATQLMLDEEEIERLRRGSVS